MGQLIKLGVPLQMTGKVTVTTRCAFSKRILSVQERTNTLSSAFKAEIVKDLVNKTGNSTPKVMAFSRDVVSNSPFPTALTNEFRAGISTFADGNKWQIVCVLGSSEGNSGGGNIRSIGFYYGTSATLALLTGSLGSLVNSLNVAKTSAIEVTFQYEITFG
jgi:hypothetical protein